MNILVASDREYKKTSRGIDIITTFLAEKGHTVDHLVFLKRRRIAPKQVGPNIRQLYFFDFLGLYRDKMRPFLPGFILRLYFSHIIKKQHDIDFSGYEWVILESGYPVYLSLVLANKIIYRLSDPPEIAFNSNRSFYQKLELHILKKCAYVSSAIRENLYPLEYSGKFVFWHSGYIPMGLSDAGLSTSKKFVFMGGGEIDFSLLNKISKRYPDYLFHIIGSFKKNKTEDNVIFHGYLEYNEYQKLVSGSSVCIIPFSKKFSIQLRRCYFTAKILLPMSLGIPVLLKNYGTIQESDPEKKLFVYKSHNEALTLLDGILRNIESGKLNRKVSNSASSFLYPQTASNRLKELDKTFSEWLK